MTEPRAVFTLKSMRKILALIIAGFASHSVHAEFSSGLGIFALNLNRTTTSNTAEKTLIGPMFYPVIVRYQTSAFWGDLRWAPYTSFTHLTTLAIKNETPDGTAKRNFAIVSSPLVYPMGPQWFLSAGPGLMYYELKGEGGTKVVNNGTGTTVFGVPSKTRSSKVFIFEIGSGWQINEYRIGVDLYFSGLSSDRLSTSFQASLSRSFGGQSW